MNSHMAKPISRIKVRNRQEIHEVGVIDKKCTHKILVEAQRQLEDIEEEFGLSSVCKDLQTSHLFVGMQEEKNNGEASEEKENSFLEDIELYEDSLPQDIENKRFFNDLLSEKRTEVNTLFSGVESMEKLNPIYKGIVEVLSRYSSGKLPKAFKVLPTLNNWEQLLYVTEPDKWTESAMFQATKLFSSGLNSEKAQRFYNLILLPRIRDEIAQCKRLNLHLYKAVKKALYKPKAFFRGIIIPLCQSGTCTMREATILSSILATCSIPADPSNITLLLITQLDFSCANCIFIRCLLEKKYNLYIDVIDGVVDYFLRFAKDDKSLPIMWHYCLLTFVKCYKNSFSQAQQQEILKLLKLQKHYRITPEIYKELLGTSDSLSKEKHL